MNMGSRGEDMSIERRLVFSRRLVGIVDIFFRLITRTGLLIRMPEHAQAYRIGGADLYPMTTRYSYDEIGEIEVPYIPGSSLKGRMRALLEQATGQKLYTTDSRIWQYVRSISVMSIEELINDVRNRNVISELFGWAAVNYKQLQEELDKAKKSGGYKYNENILEEIFSNYLAPTRLIFSDLFPSKDYVEKIKATSISDFLEKKPENRIDRITSAADPREVVRVKPGVEFEGRVSMLLYNIDNDSGVLRRYLETLVLGFKLIEKTYLGGSGSRGYGKVSFQSFKIASYRITDSGDSVYKLEKLDEKIYSNTDDLEEKIEELVKDLSKIFESAKKS